MEQQIKEAIAFHLDGLPEEGLPIPFSHSYPAFACAIADFVKHIKGSSAHSLTKKFS